MTKKVNISTNIFKVDEKLGLVFGFAIICKEDGEDYFDLQGDHIPEHTMIKAASDFMVNSRVAKDMHEGDQVGQVVFAFPMTEDIAKSLDIDTPRTGLLIGMKFSNSEILAKFSEGDYTGFSIGGRVKESDVVDA